MQKNILITGGTGLVGQALRQLLSTKNYRISYLSRLKKSISDIQVYQWDVGKGFIEEKALANADYIIHLAGAGVADKTWTEARKKEILESRTKSTDLLAQKLKELHLKPKAFIAASGAGIYGIDAGNQLLNEKSPFGTDFLAEVSKAWEKSIDSIAESGIRTIKLRIGIVLSKKGGALPKIAQPIRYGAGAALGSGKQYLSWIHIVDLCNLFLYALENEQLQGAYNAVSDNPVTNAEFTKILAKVLHKPLILPNVPAFVLKMMLGEMASIVLGGNKVSNQKIKEAGFSFQFTELSQTLKDILD